MWWVVLIILVVAVFFLYEGECGDSSVDSSVESEAVPSSKNLTLAMSNATEVLSKMQGKNLGHRDAPEVSIENPEPEVSSADKFVREEVDAYLQYVTMFGSDAEAIRALSLANSAMETVARIQVPDRTPARIPARVPTRAYVNLQPRLETAMDAPLLTAVERTDDPQVAHDTAVLDQCRDAIAAMKADCGLREGDLPSESASARSSLRSWMHSLVDNRGNLVRESPHAVEELDDVLGRADNPCAGFGASVVDVMEMVRRRARDPANRENRAQIERNVASALINVAREENCNVRLVDEMVASLATLDTADPSRGLLARGEELRAEALTAAADAAKECAEEMKENSAARAYLATSPTQLRSIKVSPDDEISFRKAALARALSAAEPALSKMRSDAADSAREQIKYAIE